MPCRLQEGKWWKCMYIPGTDLESPPDVWAAFIITQVSRHLGCEDKTV